MQRKSSKTVNICTAVFILVMLAGTIFFVSAHRGNEPENPMEQKNPNVSRIYQDDSGGIEIAQKKTEAIESQTDDAQKEDETQVINNSPGSSQTTEKNNFLNGKKDGIHTPSQSVPVKTGNQTTKHETETKKTDVVYFTTSIIDQETISSYEYFFTITHLIDDLEIEQESVFVNDSLVTPFSGKVMLTEGSNSIEITVTYRTSQAREIIVTKTYTVIVDTNNLWITTTLKDMVTDNPFLKFTAYAKMGKQQADITVMLGNLTLEEKEHSYEVTLSQGENIITIEARCEKYKIVKTYSITFTPDKNYSIYTTLKNQTVNTDEIVFQALIVNGTPKAKLTVTVNGEIQPGEKQKYRAGLKIGKNIIRLTATDSNAVSIRKNYIVQYVPAATRQTEPVLNYINAEDNMEIQGDTFTLDVGAEDYKGNRIYYDGITVKLNGKKLQYRWSSQYTSYVLNLKNGWNQLELRLTDGDGRYKDFSYHLNCTYLEEGAPIGSVTVSMDAKVIHIGELMRQKKVELYYGDTVASVFERAIENSGYTYDYLGTVEEGFYIESIHRPGLLRGWRIDEPLRQEIIEDGLQLNIVPETGEYVYDMDSLGQFDFCQGSGWVYAVNCEYKTYGMSEHILKDGDTVSIRYTLAYGKDIGAYDADRETHGIKETYDNTY